jgi:hypothetical protein
MAIPAVRLRSFPALVVWLVGCGAVDPEGATVATNDALILRAYLAEHPGFIASHHEWHRANAMDRSYGSVFLVFHHRIIAAFDRWRQAQGYPPTPLWEPSDPIPAEAPHDRRDSDHPSSVDPRCKRPTWFTLEGGTAVDPHTGATKLSDFKSSVELGGSINAPGDPGWHGSVHNAIGGDMGDLHTAPLDPVFWRFHKLIDSIWLEYLKIRGLPPPSD